MFNPVPKDFDVPALEQEIIAFWAENEVEQRYLRRNEEAEERFSFIDGPITANGEMGVHHAWGRTYKDLWQRYNTMLGKRQRYQNGFDCQGLWVEVLVEKELGFTSKRDIETYGIAEFVRKCKERVFYFASRITAQTQRLGNFMDWPNSYYTLSDENNYTIWHFLKTCHERGLIYRGTDVMPWCTRCATGLSEHEIVTEGYKDLTHRSVYVRFPLLGRPGENLLVWTTTPWTLTSNVAVAVSPELTYIKAQQGQDVFYVAEGAASTALHGDYQVLEKLPGTALLGLRYGGPFDDFPAAEGAEHVVIPWDDVSEAEGTGLVHIAPGCGKEDFALGKQFDLAVIAPLDDYGVFQDGFDWLTGENVREASSRIIENLRERGFLYRAHDYTHRYPVCWRCGTELVFRLVDEWFISMDPLRAPMMDVVRNVTWLPSFGLDRELDWLRNMGDWMISKKRYWGLALPFWICPNNHLHVIGGKHELFQRALGGLDDLESPHRPWVDEVTIACPECGEVAERIRDVGNPWLDAGIVPYSTLRYDEDRSYWQEWFPADFITESFPGQFRNWFYSMLAMSTVLEDREPFKTVLGYALLRDKNGNEMHKSWGNSIPFDEAADRTGADPMRWLFALHNPEMNLNFGWEALDEVNRRLRLLWNTYSFFVTYARLDGWTPEQEPDLPASRSLLDRWILARLNETIGDVREGLDGYDSTGPARSIEQFVEELSTWYVRRSRRRFWKAENDADKNAAYATLYECLTVLSRVMAPFMPFLAENLYQNLERTVRPDAALSVHLVDYPASDAAAVDRGLLEAMAVAQQVVALGRAAREHSNLKVRQPLATIFVGVPPGKADALLQMRDIVLDELNVKNLELAGAADEFVRYSVRPNLPVLGPRFGKQIPQIRAGLERLDPTAVAHAVERGQNVTVALEDGRTVELEPREILPSAEQREGYAAVAENGFVVALDTRLTPELIHEGWARELIRRLNDWRRSAGFDIADRISVRYRASPELASAIDSYGDYIRQETLAVSLQPDALNNSGFRGDAAIGDQTIEVELEAMRSKAPHEAAG